MPDREVPVPILLNCLQEVRLIVTAVPIPHKLDRLKLLDSSITETAAATSTILI